jgi:hypothetical protein
LIVAVFFFPVVSISAWLFAASLWGAIGAMFPDFLQFVYYKTRREPLKSLQRFHLFMHAKMRLDDYRFIGPALQILIVVGVVWLTLPLL